MRGRGIRPDRRGSADHDLSPPHRTPDATDRRAFRLALTTAGEKQRRAIAGLQESVSATAFAALIPAGRTQPAGLLTKVLTPHQE
ncbi:hypothetical protein [Nocardia sp. NPDC046763]|uniref:hypothetical protein n=1 Tax=Nocardia sp. NPDC046763 TaxID=3155256 RepID=UPI003403A3A0